MTIGRFTIALVAGVAALAVAAPFAGAGNDTMVDDYWRDQALAARTSDTIVDDYFRDQPAPVSVPSNTIVDDYFRDQPRSKASKRTPSPTRITIKVPRLAQSGEIVRVVGRVVGGTSIVTPGLFRVSEAGSTIRRKIIRIHESRFRTWTRLSKPGVYRVAVFYPGDSGSGGGSGHLPSSASVKIRVT